jgi:hypothetical protein
MSPNEGWHARHLGGRRKIEPGPDIYREYQFHLELGRRLQR